jgi:hypothetical protein
VDVLTGLSFGLDMTALIQNDELEPAGYIQTFINHFSQDVLERLQRVK